MKEESFKKYNDNIILEMDFKEIFSNDLKLINSGSNMQNYNKKTKKKGSEIDNSLLDVDCTIFTICQCFLYHHLLKHHKNLHRAYNQYFKQNKIVKDWYRDYVFFSKEPRDKQVQKFRKVIFNLNKIKSKLEQIPNLGEINEITPSFHLICGMIKADALGIPSKPPKVNRRLEFCRGESCFIDINEILHINIRKSTDEKKYDEIEINKTKHLPPWFDYRIKNGILIMYGKPDYFEQGTYNVTLIDRNNFKIRSQNIVVVTSDKKGTNGIIEMGNNGKMFDSEELFIADESCKKNEIK